ncbi:Hypothetical predicted protein, partial [Paramuricea clavata]
MSLMKRYSREKARSRRGRISSLENTLYHLSRREQNGDDVARFIKETKDLLELEHQHRADGAKLRAKEQWAEEGSLSFTQHTGLISLLYTKHDKLDTKNWRPISLLCTDYKILAKVLTNRLKSVISSVVSSSQTCGVPGRFSSESVRLLQDIINHSNGNDIGGALISLDQEKALDWSFVQRVLVKMNFGLLFRSWVQLLYSGISSHVLVNGFTSEAFRVSRGVRQGCPLSPLLYILVAETVSSAIKKDPHIDGIVLPDGPCVKLFQYADDTSILVRSYQALLSVFSLFARYEKASGAKLNVGTSHGLLFGSWRTRLDLPVPLNWSNVAITVLGCRLGNDDAVDWNSLIERFEGKLCLWKQRQLTFCGRSLIVNMLGLSIFWYQATIFDMPKTVIFRINKLLFPFVWGKKREWMARSSVSQPLAQGGLGIVDVSLFFNFYVSMHFGQPVRDVLVRDHITAYWVKKLPSFYADLIRAWLALRGKQDSGEWVIPRPSADPLPISELTASIGYTFLLCLRHVDHRSVAKFRDHSLSVQWPEVWASLRLWRFIHAVQDTSWLSFHGILPTADRLTRFGMHVDPPCFCVQPENLLHLFTSCHFALAVLDWFLIQFRKFNPSVTSIPASTILFGFPS